VRNLHLTQGHDMLANMFHLLVRRFAVDVVGPKVREMDEAESMDPEIVKALFDQGVRPPLPLPLADG
jgi:hypothetical protein